MTQSNIPVTSGTGNPVDVWQTTLGNLRQGVVIADPSTDANTAAVTASNALKVDISATAVNATAIKVDPSGVTSPVSIAGNQAVNVAQVGGNAVSTAASGIQTVGLADGAGNKVTSNSTTTTSKFAPDANILSILGTAPTTAGKLDVKGADGDIFVRQATAANLNATVVQGTATNLKAQTVSGDATGSAVPANAYYDAGIAQTSLPSAATAGNLTGQMVDKFGRQVVLLNGMRDLVTPITQLTLTSTTTETTLIGAVASTFNDLLSLSVINTSATATQVDFRDSTGGTIRFSVYVPAGDMRGVVFNTPLPQGTVNNNWTAKCGTSVASVIITGHYIANK